MGKKVSLTNRIFESLEKGGKIPCIYEGCKGSIVRIRERFDTVYDEISEESTIFYRCNHNCKHRWKLLMSNHNAHVRNMFLVEY